MRGRILAAGVGILGLLVQSAAAQSRSGAAPVPGTSFQPAPAPAPPSAPARPAQLPSSPGRVLSPPVSTSTDIFPTRPSWDRPTLGNMPAAPLSTPAPNDPHRDLYRARRGTYDRLQPFPGPYYGGGYGYAETYDNVPADTARQRTPSGYAIFRVQPASAEVVVDGYFLGTVADLAGGRALPEGPHKIEFRAAGFDTMANDVRILAGETMTFNRSLIRTAAPSAPAVAQANPAPAKPFYVIRGCYAGSTHPKDVRLPSGCDVANVRVVGPIVNQASGPRS